MTGVGKIAEGTGSRGCRLSTFCATSFTASAVAPLTELGPKALKSQGPDVELRQSLDRGGRWSRDGYLGTGRCKLQSWDTQAGDFEGRHRFPSGDASKPRCKSVAVVCMTLCSVLKCSFNLS